MSPRFLMSALRWLLAMLLALSAGAALGQSEQQKLVNAADTTFLNFMRDPQMTWLQQNIGRAKGVLIAPEVVKAGFIFGGSGGRAVLVVRDAKSGKWVGPAFYTLATASVGFQAGGAVRRRVAAIGAGKFHPFTGPVKDEHRREQGKQSDGVGSCGPAAMDRQDRTAKRYHHRDTLCCPRGDTQPLRGAARGRHSSTRAVALAVFSARLSPIGHRARRSRRAGRFPSAGSASAADVGRQPVRILASALRR